MKTFIITLLKNIKSFNNLFLIYPLNLYHHLIILNQ